jgi:hypothetical protein
MAVGNCPRPDETISPSAPAHAAVERPQLDFNPRLIEAAGAFIPGTLFDTECAA